MKKKIIKMTFITLPILLIAFVVTFLYRTNTKEYKINKVLKSEYYSYLPQEAKNYIKEVYEDTGQIVSTEMNKEENVPFLNPQYVDYLTLSETEKKSIEVIPSIYSVEYDYMNVNSANDLPSSYNLLDDNYITPLKNQETLGICWTFAAVEQAESNLMVTNHQTYNASTKVFSPRQIDYAASTDGINNYKNVHGFRELTTGGNFYMSSELMSYGLSLVDENVMPFNTDVEKKEVSEVLNFTNSNYEVNHTVDMPVIFERLNGDYSDYVEECSQIVDEEEMKQCLNNYTDEIKQRYIQKIKTGIKDYGGVEVETMPPGVGSCSFTNTDNTYAVEVFDSCYNVEEGHAMHIIGWDDNYSYSYCRGAKKNSDVVNNQCSSGTKVDGTGAFIMRNSWGNEYAYSYLTYDSITDSKASPMFHFIVDMTDTSSRGWDNVYYKNVDYSSFFRLSTQMSQSFTKKIAGEEKIDKIKFNTYSSDGIFSIKITDGEKVYQYNDILSTDFPGIYTIDLSEKNIVLEEDSFNIEISTKTRKAYAMDNSISVFTKNVDSSPVIESDNVIGFVLDEPKELSTKILYNTKNIPSGEKIDYSLVMENGDDFSSYLTVTNNIVAENNANVYVKIAALPVGKYKLIGSYNGAKNEMPISVQTSIVNVNYYANNGSDDEVNDQVERNKTFTLKENTFVKEGYKFVGWNTSSDGTGNSYKDKASITNGINADLSLYAQWEPVQYILYTYANDGTQQRKQQILTYDKSENIIPNSFIRKGYQFFRWNTKADGTGTSYNSQQSVLNLASKENEVVNLYAQWKPITYKIAYNAGTGTGSLPTQTVTYDKKTPLTKYNGSYMWKETNTFYGDEKFTVFLSFKEWNTVKDGSGTSYADQQEVLNLASNQDETITLYAQWEVSKYFLIFDSNDENSQIERQLMNVGETSSLNANVFSREGYLFNGWNTKADGTGTSYTDQQEVINLTTTKPTTVLYAQWKPVGKPITNITLDKDSLTIVKGDYASLSASLEPVDTTDNRTITWTSSNTRIATVSNGKIRGISKGQAIITAKSSNGLTATCTVTVKGTTGWVTQNGNKYYYDDGIMVKGIYEINGKWYHFGQNTGQLKTGWSITLDKKEYYSDKNGVMKFEWVTEGGNKYYITKEEGAYKGIYEIGGKYYHFGQNSKQLKTGWSITLDKKEYYSDKNGVMKFEWVTEGGNKYYITKEDGAYKGIYKIGEKYYHFGQNSKQLKVGWSITLDKLEYYSNENGELLKGIQKINGRWYHFGENSYQLKKGWSITLDKKEYYSDQNGVMQFGWVTEGGNKYYITREEGAYKGIYKIGEKYYHFGQNSKQLKTGWSVTLDKKEYYSDQNGVMQFGWVYVNGKKYYITLENGVSS